MTSVSVPAAAVAAHSFPDDKLAAPRPMLLSGYDPAIFRRHKTVFVSEKYDGWRTYYRDGVFYTRNGNILTLPTCFYSALALYAKFGLEFDGELWLGYGTTSSDLSSFDGTRVLYKIFDVAGPAAGHLPFRERYAILRSLEFRGCDGRISAVEHVACASVAEMEVVYNAVIARGGEGVVLRGGDQRYVHGIRDTEFQKKKPVESLEARVLEYHKTAGAPSDDYVSSLIVGALDGSGAVFKVSVKSTAPPALGAIVTVRYSQRTSTGLPKFPVLVGIRDSADMPADVLLAAASAPPKPRKPSAPSSFPESEMSWRLTHPCCAGIYDIGKHGGNGIPNGYHLYWDNGRGAYYKVSRAKSGDVYYCSCDAWKWQALAPQYRTCKHCIAVGGWKPVVPAAVRAAALMRKAERLLAKKS